MPSVRRFSASLAAAAFAALLLAAPSGAAIREIGVTNGQPLPKASCPTNCQAVDQVTGYQVQIGKSKNPYLMKSKGKIVAFTIALGKPNAKQMTFFNNLFGTKPQARLSILKLGHRNRQATLTAQSGTFDLTNYLGSTPQFALDKPLRVGPRDVVALTVPTWAPAFAVKLGTDQAWRSSRSSSACNDVQQQASHQTLKTVRSYGCFYRTARLLYSATFIPDPKPTKTTKK
jgi:hypothetical protein